MGKIIYKASLAGASISVRREETVYRVTIMAHKVEGEGRKRFSRSCAVCGRAIEATVTDYLSGPSAGAWAVTQLEDMAKTALYPLDRALWPEILAGI
jgi:hypothetical protein